MVPADALRTAIIVSPFTTPAGTFSTRPVVTALAELVVLERYVMTGQVIERPRSASVSATPTTPELQTTVAVFVPEAAAAACATSSPSLESVPVVATSFRSVMPTGGVHVADAVPHAA